MRLSHLGSHKLFYVEVVYTAAYLFFIHLFYLFLLLSGAGPYTALHQCYFVYNDNAARFDEMFRLYLSLRLILSLSLSLIFCTSKCICEKLLEVS
jgi:hypothetical protein